MFVFSCWHEDLLLLKVVLTFCVSRFTCDKFIVGPIRLMILRNTSMQ